MTRRGVALAGQMTSAEEPLDVAGLHVAIVASRYHPEVVDALVVGALDTLANHGVEAISIDRVPGAFELPLAALARATSETVDAVIALGCVIQGETPHFSFVCAESARGLMDVMLETGVPVSFGVLTTGSMEQALARAGGAVGNKGAEAALSALEMASMLRHSDEHVHEVD